MLDQLNLTEIRAEIVRKTTQRARILRGMRYIFWGLLFFFVLLLVLLPVTEVLPDTYDAISPIVTLFRFIPFLLFLVMLILSTWLLLIVLAYRDDRERAARANAILPTLLPQAHLRLHAHIQWFEIISLVSVGIALIVAITVKEYIYGFIFIALFFLLRYARVYRLRLEVRWLYKGALAQGNYDAALKRADTFLRWMPHHLHYLNAKGFILLMAGRSEEAERHYSQAITYGQHYPLFLTAFMVNLGASLMQRERLDEAFPLLQAAAQIMPDYKEYTANLAGYYLGQNIYPERALELMEYTLEGVPQPNSNHFLEGYIWSMQKIQEARASALTGRMTRAEAALEAALTAADESFLPGMSALYLQIGYLRRNQGESAAARDYFSRAQQIDPNGYSGKCAAKELAKE
jgi:Flp pilus assembly protein TadD